MGPQPNGHGYLESDLELIEEMSGFNGATTQRSWIHDKLTAVKFIGVSKVSMGPQPNGHGYSI
jgi:hypothetical protein